MPTYRTESLPSTIVGGLLYGLVWQPRLPDSEPVRVHAPASI